MAASGIIASTGAADTSAALFTPYFEGYSSPMAQCDGITLQAGPEPSYALARVPLNAIDDTAPAVAAVTSGPLYAIRIGSECEITDHNGTKVMRGTVTQITHLLGDKSGDDAGTCLIEDARRIMKKFPIVGSFWRSNGGIAYRQGWPPIFNQGGQPNCSFVSGVPVFCISNYGLRDGQSPGDMDTEGSIARYWSNQTILKYLHYIATTGSTVARASFPDYPESILSSVNWDSGYASAVAQPVVATPPNGVKNQRKAAETNLDSTNLCDALTQVLHAEGSWDLYITPANNVIVVATKFSSGGSSIYCPTGDANTEFAKPKVIIGGTLIENGENLYRKAWSAGEITCIETRVTSENSSTGLEPAWSAADFSYVKTQAQAAYNANFGLQESINMAIASRPNVLKTYRINPTYNFQAGTSESGKPIAQVGRPVLDTLLSTKLEGNAGFGTQATDQYRYRMPTQFEYYKTDVFDPEIPDWHPATIADGFTVAIDGTIQVIGLLNEGSTYQVEESGEFPNKVLTITPRAMRITVAIPCDHRLTASAQSPIGEDDRISNDVRSTYYATTNLYSREYRGGTNRSWPIAESTQVGTPHPAANGYLRNDLPYLQAHATRRADIYTRLVRGGQFVCPTMSLAYDVGQQLSIFTGSRNGFPIRSVIRRIELKCGPGEQSQIIHTDDVGYVGYDEQPGLTMSAIAPVAYKPNTSDNTSQTQPKVDYNADQTPEYQSSTPTQGSPAYTPTETKYGSDKGYSPSTPKPKQPAYSPTSGPDTATSAPAKGSVADDKAVAAQGDEEDRVQTGKGASKDVSDLTSKTTDPYAAFRTKYTEEPKENTPAPDAGKGRGDDMLKREFGV